MSIVSPTIHKPLPKNEQAAIDDFVSQLKKLLGDNLVLVMLYGSKARGDWHQESDIDLFVVIDNYSWELKNQISELAYSVNNNEPAIRPIIYSYDDYLDATHPLTAFMYHVLRDGQKLYEKPHLSSKLE